MSDSKNPLADTLKACTEARIFLGHTGNSLPTEDILQFQYAHAAARDAVYSTLSVPDLTATIYTELHLSCLALHSCASTREQYLKNPALGRQLHPDSVQRLGSHTPKGYKLAIVVADGLSAQAITNHLLPFLRVFIPLIQAVEWSIAPICIAEQGRVAIGDPIGALLGADMVVVCIGERPGLSSPDSMGVYVTYHPRPGLTDESRNCLSNIRTRGLSYELAAHKLYYLLQKGFALQATGVELKDDFQGLLT